GTRQRAHPSAVAEEPAASFWDEPLAGWLRRLNTSEKGLTRREARRRLAADGPNELPGERSGALALEVLSFFKNPLVIILLQATGLFANEAALTGESLPAGKSPAGLSHGPHPLAEADNSVFLGTSVVSGAATAVAIRTGPVTQFGQVAHHLTLRPPDTEFE